MEYSAKQLTHPKLTDEELTDLSLQILNHYKDGKYAFDDEVSAQSQSHHNHKRYCKDALKEFLNKDDKVPIRKYIVPLTDYLKETNSLKVQHLKLMNRQLQRKVDDYILKDVGQNKSHCGVCHYVIKDAVEKQVNQYKEENSDNAKDKTIDHLRRRIKTAEQKCNEYDEYKRNMRYTTNVPTDEYNKMVLKISTLEAEIKDNKGSNDVKKLKKQIKKQAKIILTLQNAASSSEDSSAEEDDDF
tara:strand:- start:228 stop:956 length:729 start_codon:yes stop_codon:yes gene_type:complete